MWGVETCLLPLLWPLVYTAVQAMMMTMWRVCCCSPDGKLLASVGGDPDYMLTLWDWKREKIVLRSKAFSQDIFRITFSTELLGQLTTSGVGHIRWNIYIRQVNGVKLTDISLYCFHFCLSVCAHSVQSSATEYGVATRRWRHTANANKYRPIVTLRMRPPQRGICLYSESRNNYRPRPTPQH